MKLPFAALLLVLLPISSVAQFVPTKIDGAFSISLWDSFGGTPQFGVSNPDFPSGVTGSFSYTLNVPQSGDFFFDNLTPASVAIAPAFGGTTFSPANVGLQLWFSGGNVTLAILGGLLDGISGWGSPNVTSDFFVILKPGVGGESFFYQIDGLPNNYYAPTFSGTLTQMALPASAVPESSAFGIGAGVLAIGLMIVRRGRGRV